MQEPAGRGAASSVMLCAIAVATVVFASAGNPAQAQSPDWPAKTVRIVLPFAPGGGTDFLTRALAQRLAEQLGQPFVVDNRPGAGGNIGAELVAKGPVDGYTWMVSTASVAVNVTLYPKAAFDARKDLLPVTQLASAPILLTVHPSVPARNLKELIALAKRTKGGLNYGSNGVGTASHLAGVMLAQMTGMQLTHVAYKGAGPAVTALLGGEVEMAFPAVNTVAGFVRTGKLRGLAVTTARSSSLFPDVPPVAAQFPGFDIDNWFMMFARSSMPPALIDRIYGEVVKAMQHPEMKSFVAREGAEPVVSKPADAAAFFQREIEKFARIIQQAGIKVDG
jgi:tripartite-type tricarboxylate transporter receptor subunit TctC